GAGVKVVGVSLQVRAIFVRRHLSRPGAAGKPGRTRDVLHRRRPGRVILLVVHGPERFEFELGSPEPEGNFEVRRDELGQHAILDRWVSGSSPEEGSAKALHSRVEADRTSG